MNTSVYTKNAPAAIGPYSQAVKSGDIIFVSGQLPLNPATGEMEEADIKKQTSRCLENITAVLKEADFYTDDIVKCDVFLKDLKMFADFNGVYADYFKDTKPARVCVEVSRLPKDSLIEISAVAVKNN